MPDLRISRQRLRNHRMIGEPLANPEAVVGWLGAVQAQEYGVAKWGIAQRTEGSTDADLDRMLAEGTLVRTHVMRPTWHFVLPADLRWLLALTGPRVQALNAGRYRQLGLDADQLARGAALMGEALRGGGHLTRAELAAVLHAGGITTDGQRLAYLLMHAELEAVICSGGRRGKQFTYALFDERVPPAPPRDRDDALAESARRYFTSHGPATAHDFAWWSGLTVADARRGAELAGAALASFNGDGKAYWTNPVPPVAEVDPPTVHLLPVYDEYLGSYKNYSPIFDPVLNERISPGSDTLLFNILVVDGLVAGGWKRTVKAKEAIITLDSLIPLDDAARAAIAVEADRFGRFLGLPVTVRTSEA